MHIGLHVSARYFCSILMKIEISKNTQISNFMNIRLVRAELFHADRRTHEGTDMTKLIVAIRNFANARKKKQTFQIIMLYVGFPVCMRNSPILNFLILARICITIIPVEDVPTQFFPHYQ
jgi:hypothetical protein